MMNAFNRQDQKMRDAFDGISLPPIDVSGAVLSMIKETGSAPRRRHRTMLLFACCLVAAALCLGALALLPGNVQLEGQQEPIGIAPAATKLSYQMQYDVETYSLTHEEDTDRYLPIQSVPEGYPPVSLTIRLVRNAQAETLAQQNADGAPVEDTTLGSGAYSAKTVFQAAGTQADSATTRFWFLQQGDDVYQITLRCFVEAEEGHGARLLQMLNSFTLQ